MAEDARAERLLAAGRGAPERMARRAQRRAAGRRERGDRPLQPEPAEHARGVAGGRSEDEVGGGHLVAQLAREDRDRGVDLGVALEAPAWRAVAAGLGRGRHLAEGEVLLDAVVARAAAEQVVQRERDR